MNDNELRKIFDLDDCGDYYILSKKASSLFKDGNYKYQTVEALAKLIKESADNLYNIALLDDSVKLNRVLSLITEYGPIHGNHHKQWVLDQVIRILVDDYSEWIKINGYKWDTGIAP